MVEARKPEKYEALIFACHALAPVRTAVAHPCDEASLRGALEAAAARITKPILVGPETRIRTLAASLSLDLDALRSSTRRTAMQAPQRRSSGYVLARSTP